ncbi:(2Fe-2S)-binding protein [Chelativorans sp. YIM 93263]|uniref:(2Fe-2S)-binding protein n=1 Tax=Chelativorans sp. YIM 93263 TaxID=2906648 RepID=UPI0023789E5D|nr:(2Fe-2S)-binding protein [Chelativorans sp. YIM 93263]
MVALNINGHSRDVDVAEDVPLLYVLRNDLELNGAKFGCGLAQCGACTVVVDGEAMFSCVTPVSSVEGAEIITVEGLGTERDPHPLQAAFIEEQAAQCGYCIAGMIMRAHTLLESNSSPSEDEIRQHMAPNLCRCGTHARIVRAVRRAAEMASAEEGRTPAREGADQ